MKIAISSMDENIKGNVAETFGRCSYFIVAEIDDGKIAGVRAIKNEGIDQSSGSGIFAARLMAEKNINAVIAGSIGPRAIDILKQFGIEAYSGEGKIEDITKKFIEGKIKKIS